MSHMRTTLTLDNDISEKLSEIMHRQRISFKQVVNEVLRRGLGAQDDEKSERSPYRVETFQSDFRPGVDLARLNQLSDDLEVDHDNDRARGDR